MYHMQEIIKWGWKEELSKNKESSNVEENFKCNTCYCLVVYKKKDHIGTRVCKELPLTAYKLRWSNTTPQ